MEGYTSTGMVFAAQEPYPPVQAERPNHRYAEAMLDNVGGSNSEMSAVGLYFYGHLAALEVPEAAEIFQDVYKRQCQWRPGDWTERRRL